MARPSKKTEETTETKKSIVQPNVTFVGGKNHPMEDIINSDDPPEMKAVGFKRVSESSGSWVSYVITFKGDKIIKIEVDEPNLRGIAEETSKIYFVNEFVDQE